MLKNCLLVVLLFGLVSNVAAQKKSGLKMESLTPANPVICYASTTEAHTYVGPPQEYLQWKNNPSARTQTANIIVTYEGFTTEAQQAFQAAVDIWKTLISSPVPIRIRAQWVSLASGVLGSASPATYFRGFDGAQKLGVWYPIALAEKMGRKELNSPAEPDIVASFSSNINWYYGTSGSPSTGQYDLVSVVLHEIGHGLGVTRSYEVDGVNGQIISFFGNFPVVYESFIENNNNQDLLRSFTSPSTALASQITGNNLFFNSRLVLARNNNTRAKIFAPATYNAGSSIAHLDETTYPIGSGNSLMTPFIGAVEVIQNPGPIVMSILKDMGWNNIFIKHTPIKTTEVTANDFPVVCQIDNDTTFDASSVKLNYTLDGTNFTTVTMAPTGTAKEFRAVIPKPTSPTSVTAYGYYISVQDVVQRTFLSPGTVFTQGQTATRQATNVFEAGPDSKPPTITHAPVSFVKTTDTQLALTALLTDNIGIKNAVVEYLINDVARTPVAMAKSTDDNYTASIALALAAGDKIKYRIKATDNSIAGNVQFSPATGYYDVNVVNIAPTQDSYSTDFNSPNTDFFGDPQFSITKPTGFNDNAIHSVHPYPDGTGANKESNFVYQLRIPIRLKATDALLRFDEIALVEPGEPGSKFGDPEFFDYVVVEGSKDGGATWKALADGYDARDQSDWLAKWNSSKDNAAQPNSTGAGDPSLFKTRTINLLGTTNFKAGDEIVIRFRLFADELVHGWGWAIDNLKIQVDDIPPVIQHNHVDFLSATATTFSMTAKATDGSGLQSLTFEYGVNGGTTTNTPATLVKDVDQYTLNVALTGFKAGDEIQYRIKAKDLIGNETILPASGFLRVPLLDFSSTLTTYSSDFNSANTDFAGNFFAVNTASGFENGAINSSHPYPTGFGLAGTSNFTYMLKRPIVIGTSNPFMAYREILIAEYLSLTAVKDFAVVEGSKDNGTTWEPITEQYSSNAFSEWRGAMDASAAGTAIQYKNRIVNLTGTGKFKAGDAVLIRFRLFSDNVKSGWGWAIDNLSIQGVVTGIEPEFGNTSLSVFPNPTKGTLSLLIEDVATREVKIDFVTAQGALCESGVHPTENKRLEKQVDVTDWASGMYLIKVQIGTQILVRKFMKQD